MRGRLREISEFWKALGFVWWIWNRTKAKSNGGMVGSGARFMANLGKVSRIVTKVPQKDIKKPIKPFIPT